MADDYYDILGVQPTATAEAIKKRFRFLSHAYHPDKFATEPHKKEAEEDFKRINEAYEILSDPLKRARFDAARSTPPPRSSAQPPTYDAPPRQSEYKPASSPSQPSPPPTAFTPAPPMGRAKLVGILALCVSAGFALMMFISGLGQLYRSPSNSAGANSGQTETRAKQLAAIKAPAAGESVEFDMPIYPNGWSEPIRIPNEYHLRTQIVGEDGLKIWCATDDDRNGAVLMTKRVPPTAGETWDIWSSSLLGLYNPLAKRMPYMTGKKASSVQYKSAESFPVEIRIRLEPVQRTGSFDQREESTSDSTLAATTPQPVLQPGQAIQSGTPELAYIFPTIAPSFATPETAPAFPGERYPDTRSRVFVAGELQSWSTDQLQYAINEIFARHGGDFPDKKEVREYFGQFAWYHPHRGSSLDQIEASLPYVEQQNVKILGEVRNIKRNPLSVAAGNWYGILYWRDGTVNKQELIFASDLRQVANRASSLDAASGWNNYPVQKRGSTLTWQIAGLGRITYLTFAPDGNGQQAQVSSQIVQQGRVAYSAAGMFYRYDVPLPIPNTSSPDPQARQIFGGFLEGISQAIQNAGASGSNGSNTFRPPNKRRRGP